MTTNDHLRLAIRQWLRLRTNWQRRPVTPGDYLVLDSIVRAEFREALGKDVPYTSPAPKPTREVLPDRGDAA